MDDETKRRRTSIIKPLLTRSQWDQMLSAYRERPSATYVANAARVPIGIVRRAISLGFPEFGWPPFVQLGSAPQTVHKHLSVLHEDWKDAVAAKTESAKQAAQEALAARIGMSSAMKCAQMTHTFVEKVLAKMDADDFEVPEELTPKVIFQLAKALETTNNVLAKAMEIQNKRAGAPENTIGTVVIDLLERCSDGELEEVAHKGELPQRITGQKRVADLDGEALPTGAVEEPPYAGPTDPFTVAQKLRESKDSAEKDLIQELKLPGMPPEYDPELACVIGFEGEDAQDDDEEYEQDETEPAQEDSDEDDPDLF